MTVVADEPGGKIHARFDSVEAATQCAQNLAGRWFDKRQLRVEYVVDEKEESPTKQASATDTKEEVKEEEEESTKPASAAEGTEEAM